MKGINPPVASLSSIVQVTNPQQKMFSVCPLRIPSHLPPIVSPCTTSVLRSLGQNVGYETSARPYMMTEAECSRPLRRWKITFAGAPFTEAFPTLRGGPWVQCCGMLIIKGETRAPVSLLHLNTKDQKPQKGEICKSEVAANTGAYPGWCFLNTVSRAQQRSQTEFTQCWLSAGKVDRLILIFRPRS